MSGGRSIVHVHHRGDRGVDGILRLIELAGHDGPIETTLTAMCEAIAGIADVDVASVYVAEGDRLVMRGNCGFPPSAIGATALRVGEGITGLVAECMRPVSAAHAAAETAYKHVPGLGEERYPVFAGVPLIAGGAAIGVLVLQRRKRPFVTDEVTLATALGAPVTLAIERRRATAIRAARLTGTTLVPGAVLGRAAVVPTATALDANAALIEVDAPVDEDVDGVPRAIDRAFARLREDLGRAMRRLDRSSRPLRVADRPGEPEAFDDTHDPATGGALDRFALALCDARLRERLAEHARHPSRLRAVAKDYARAAYVGADGADGERAGELEELCALLGDPRALKPGAVWIADRIAATVAIVAVARGASALVASDAVSPAAIAVARAAELPVVADVAGLFNWVRPNDLLAVDASWTAGGSVLVHPAPTDIERLRRAR